MTAALDKALELHAEWGLHKRSLLTLDWAEKVEAFRDLYEVPRPEGIILPEGEREELCRALLEEEDRETLKAWDERDLAEVIDGLLDAIYVRIYALHEIGLSSEQIQLAMREVHASNMTKTDDSGRPIFAANGKVMKGDNYVRANHEAALDLDFSAIVE